MHGQTPEQLDQAETKAPQCYETARKSPAAPGAWERYKTAERASARDGLAVCRRLGCGACWCGDGRKTMAGTTPRGT